MDYGFDNFLLQSCSICVVKFCYPLSLLAAVSKSVIYMVNKMKIITLSANTSWYLYNFRGSTIREALSMGWTVYCISPEDSYHLKLVQMGCKHYPLNFRSSSKNPFLDFLIPFLLLLPLQNYLLLTFQHLFHQPFYLLHQKLAYFF